MKILLIKTYPQSIELKNATYNTQGIGLAAAFRKSGYEADFMCMSDNGENQEIKVNIDGVTFTVYLMKAYALLKNAWFRDVSAIFDKYDILQVCEYNQIYSWHLAKKYKDKTVCYHGPYYCGFNKNYNRMAKVFDLLFVNRYRNLNTCFITKSGLAKLYLTDKGLKNVHAVGVGLSKAILEGGEAGYAQPEIEQIRQIKCIKLLYIGVIEPRRNSFFLLDLVYNLKKRGLNFILIMIGRYKDKDYKRAFENKIHEYRIEENILYIPRMEQKYIGQVYKMSDMFIFPTMYDIYGMVLLESMFFSIPTISTLNGGSDMMIEDGENGYVMCDFDVNKWADKVIELAENSELRANIGKEAHETIVNGFTWEKLVPKFIDIYNAKLCGEF